MNKLKYTILSALIALGTLHADTGTADTSDDLTAEQVFADIGDLVFVRPIGAGVTVANFGIFAVAAPFAAMAGATEEVFNTLVEAPGDYTFDRDLGDFSK
jgi:hypothetical protein